MEIFVTHFKTPNVRSMFPLRVMYHSYQAQLSPQTSEKRLSLPKFTMYFITRTTRVKRMDTQLQHYA